MPPPDKAAAIEQFAFEGSEEAFTHGVDAPISVKGHLLRQRQFPVACGDSRRFLLLRIA